MWAELVVGAAMELIQTAVKVWLVSRLRVDVVLGNLSSVRVGDVKLSGAFKQVEEEESEAVFEEAVEDEQ